MPSPFPGMDPYLESPQFFPGLHDQLIADVSRSLQQLLPPGYFSDIRSRVWVEYEERILEPDVSVLQNPTPTSTAGNGGATAVAIEVHPVVVLVPRIEPRESYVNIYRTQGDQRLVTTIEILSPSNKTRGGHGRDEYVRKQREMLGSRVNLVEIDLLRGGAFSTAVPHDRAVREAGPFDYHICVHRFDDPERFFVYPIPLRQRLPQVAIPLSAGDPPVVLDLQTVFDRAYDAGPYGRLNPYVHFSAEPPLPPEHVDWAAQVLRQSGRVPPSTPSATPPG